MKNQRGFTPILAAAAITFVIVVVGYFSFKKNMTSTDTASTQATVPPQYQTDLSAGRQEAPIIRDTADLDASAKALDETDTTELNSELNLLNSASLGF